MLPTFISAPSWRRSNGNCPTEGFGGECLVRGGLPPSSPGPQMCLRLLFLELLYFCAEISCMFCYIYSQLLDTFLVFLFSFITDTQHCGCNRLMFTVKLPPRAVQLTTTISLCLSHTQTGKSTVVHAVVVHGMVSSTPTPGRSLQGRHTTGTGRSLGGGLGAPVPVGGLLSPLCSFSTRGLTWPLVCRLLHLHVPTSDE